MGPNEVFYYGNSMNPVFTTGDVLTHEKIAFEALRPGDIITVSSRPVPYCHRVYKVAKDQIITHGDNNGSPDREPVTPDSVFHLVVSALSPDGKRRSVTRGRAGMRQFRRNQLRRRLYLRLCALGHFFMPVFFWRISLKECSHFSEMDCWYWHGIPVCRQDKNAILHYTHAWYKLFFKVTVPEK